MAEPIHGTIIMRDPVIIGAHAITTEAQAIEAFGPAERYPGGAPANMTAAAIDMLRAPRRMYAVPMRIDVVPASGDIALGPGVVAVLPPLTIEVE